MVIFAFGRAGAANERATAQPADEAGAQAQPAHRPAMRMREARQ
jgi:hypothetical protein